MIPETCGCPGAYVVGTQVWHTFPVTCSGCDMAARYMTVQDGLHLCRACIGGRR